MIRKLKGPIALLLVSLVAFRDAIPLWAQEAAQAAGAPAALKPEQIDQLVAPIALYPDALLAQVLMASTYPLEIVEAARWAKQNPGLTEKALEDALQKQTWDASVKSLTAFPQVLTMMNDKLDWTQKLGDAFLSQQSDVMDAAQRLRAKAQAAGNLKTTEQQKVIVEPAPAPANVQQDVTVQQPPAPTTVIKIEPANPQVVYVPTYNPTVAYGTWPYPAYPPYSPYPPGYVAATGIISFGVGMAVGAALWGGCNWGGGYGNSNVNVNVNNYNNFNKSNISNGNWQHNAEHRKGVGYRDAATQQKYGRGGAQGAQSREAFRGRADQGRQDLARGAADDFKGNAGRGDNRAGNAGRGDNRAGNAGRGDNRAGNAGRGDNRAGNAGRGDNRAGNAGADRARAGSRDVGQAQRQPQGRGNAAQRDTGRTSTPSAFKGMNNAGQTRAQSDRGQASRQSAASQSRGGFGGGGGGARGGGGGGGARGGGGGGGGRGGGGGGRGGGGRGR